MEKQQKVLISSAAGHENVISSSAPLKPPAVKSQGTLFVFAFRVDTGERGVGVLVGVGVPVETLTIA